MGLKNIEDNNFGWSAQRFSELKTFIQQGDATAFHTDLEPYLRQCALYTMNLAKKWLKKDRLDLNEKHLVQDALHDAFARFEQRMFLETVEYGNLKDWLVGNAFSRFQGLFEKEQKESGRFDSIEGVQIADNNGERKEDLMVFLIAKVLAAMPNDAKYFYQKTLKMLYWQGYSIEEIAADIKVGYENLRKELSAKIRPLFKSELQKLSIAFNVDLTKSRVPLG